MEKELLEVIITPFIDDLIIESKKIFKDLFEEGKHFIKNNINKYLQNQNNRFCYLKTLLHGGSPVYIYDIYYPLKIQNESEILSTKNIKTIFKNQNYITLIGEAGSGKSTLVKHLFLNTIKEKYGIPILIELRYLNTFQGTFEEYILNKIFDYDLTENTNILTRLLNSGKFIFFLDGFDELNSSLQPIKINEFNSFIEKHSKNKYLLTARPFTNIEYHPLFDNYELCPLDKNDVLNFIDLQLKKEEEFAEKIKSSLHESEDNLKLKYIKGFLNNPLLLSLYILTFQNNPKIPEKKYIFYRRVINALFSEHDSKSKLGYVREFESNLSQSEFEQVLKRYCFLSHFDNLYYFEYDYITLKLNEIKPKLTGIDFEIDKLIKDLKSAVSLWVEDCGIYSFAHRSLQEFYAASFIKSLDHANKKDLYTKLLRKLRQSKLSDIENLLSLCKEMDTINYLKYIELPLLEEISKKLIVKDATRMYRSFFSLFFDSMSINTLNWKIKVLENRKANRYQLITKNKQGRLYNSILKVLQENYDEAEIKFEVDLTTFKIDTNSGAYYNLQVFEFIGIKRIVRTFIKEINDMIKSNKEFIQNSSDSDKDIIDMI